MDVGISKKRVILYAIGVTCLISNSVVLYITFLWAYFTNNMVFSARINDFGEAHFELVFLTLSIFLGSYAVIKLFNIIPYKTQEPVVFYHSEDSKKKN